MRSAAEQPTELRDSLAAREPGFPFWRDSPTTRSFEALDGDLETQLAIVGGGLTGLWTAILAKQRDPGRDVVLLEADRVASVASGRNGGFCDYSLTHGIHNGQARFPNELERLERLGLENLDQIEATLEELGIDCDFERVGKIRVAVADWQLEALREEEAAHRSMGHAATMLSATKLRAAIDSPTYLGGLRIPGLSALVNPARLAEGLADAANRLGVRVLERSPVQRILAVGGGIDLVTDAGTVRARRVALATGVSKSLLRRVRPFVLPVYDYVIVTEPLPSSVRERIGWAGREGLTDSGNQFHYYRLTPDDRILFGGYDAIYHFGNAQRPEFHARPRSFDLLAEHLAETFPQLADVGLSHCWGGAIDTCSRFSPFWGRAHRGRLWYCLGFTGLGVGASRFGARVLLDLIEGRTTELTKLEMVRKKPLPFPPEPLRSLIVNTTRRARARADLDDGRRGPWLRSLDAVGLGFDS